MAKKRGGARPGAGRPKGTKAKPNLKQVSFRLALHHIDGLEELALRTGKDKSALLREFIELGFAKYR